MRGGFGDDAVLRGHGARTPWGMGVGLYERPLMKNWKLKVTSVPLLMASSSGPSRSASRTTASWKLTSQAKPMGMAMAWRLVLLGVEGEHRRHGVDSGQQVAVVVEPLAVVAAHDLTAGGAVVEVGEGLRRAVDVEVPGA